MRGFIIFLVVVAAVAVPLSIFKPWQGDDDAIDLDKGTYVVARETLQIMLTENGTLQTKNSERVTAQTSGKIEWLVEEGKTVKKGEVLVKMDRKEVEQRLEQLENQLIQNKSELESATTNELIQRDQNETDIDKAQLALDVAKVELEKLLEADAPAEERKLRLAIEEAETAARRAAEKVTANEELLKEDFVTQNDLEQARLDHKKAVNGHDTAKMNLNNYLVYTQPLDIRKKKSAVTEAERGLTSARNRAKAQLAAKTAAMQQKKVQKQRLDTAISREKKNLEKMVMKAPTDGNVIYGHPDWGNEIKVGAQVWHGMPLVTLPDPSEMMVHIQIHEADIDKIKKDMPAFVTSKTQPDKIYKGKVFKIAKVANAGRRWGGSAVKRFKVEVALEGKELGLKPGTSATVELHIGRVEDVVAVPIQAVHAKEGKYFCFRLKDGEVEQVSVELGRANETKVEIKSGLGEKDRVLLYDPEIEAKKSNGGEDKAEAPKKSEP